MKFIHLLPNKKLHCTLDMSKDLVLENRSHIYEDAQSAENAENSIEEKDGNTPGTSTMTQLTIEDKVIEQQFSRTKKVVYCITGLSIGIIAVVTVITVALTKTHFVSYV